MGFNLANFQSLSTLASLKLRRYRLVSGTAIDVSPAPSNRGVIPSGPLALFVFKVISLFATSLHDIQASYTWDRLRFCSSWCLVLWLKGVCQFHSNSGQETI